jgi:hypothetical protein
MDYPGFKLTMKIFQFQCVISSPPVAVAASFLNEHIPMRCSPPQHGGRFQAMLNIVDDVPGLKVGDDSEAEEEEVVRDKLVLLHSEQLLFSSNFYAQLTVT